jgi:hypothetical protein
MGRPARDETVNLERVEGYMRNMKYIIQKWLHKAIDRLIKGNPGVGTDYTANCHLVTFEEPEIHDVVVVFLTLPRGHGEEVFKLLKAGMPEVLKQSGLCLHEVEDAGLGRGRPEWN